MIDQQQDRTIVACLQASLPGLVAAYRFGSTTDGTARAESDVDVAVLATRALPPLERFELQEQLAAALGRDVDLVDLGAASTVMAMQVVVNGDVLYSADDALRGAFEDRVFGAYARLNEERRGILDRVASEATIYGR